ncbi:MULTISPECIES: DJ-1/PfpI family protein [Streptomyces]|uniref:DJ-1/PfpI family protein n=1 Tax=Streptomyces TaxID=1883 RepID=UPI0004BD63D5|nr:MULTISPECIES: DJ-1/PfpI family protein [Streptomyces]KPC94368.1 thiamine biosynthesis protein ThiJ [Streptomyces sp. NRRL F-6602]MDI6410966.1 DJ-1/PfpI family protein [Streptomyces albus]
MTVHLAVYDTLADWEYGHAVAHLPGGVTTVGLTAAPVVTKGGLRIEPDMTLDALRPADSELLILPGADGWTAGALADFAYTAREFLHAGVPVAAICGAVFGLADEGLLDERAHTSAAPEFLQAANGYSGAAHYRDADAVTDGDLITAGPTAPVAFAREILARLGTYEPPVVDAFYRLHQHSDPEAYAVFAAAQS